MGGWELYELTKIKFISSSIKMVKDDICKPSFTLELCWVCSDILLQAVIGCNSLNKQLQVADLCILIMGWFSLVQWTFIKGVLKRAETRSNKLLSHFTTIYFYIMNIRLKERKNVTYKRKTGKGGRILHQNKQRFLYNGVSLDGGICWDFSTPA